MAFLKLIRFPNLLIIALVQYLMRLAIMSPSLESYGYSLQMSELEFALLVISTCLLAAAGYVINNYFDRRSDMINKPDEVVVGNVINRRYAILWHFILNGIAVVIGFYLCYRIGIYKVGIVFVIVPTLLWFYSSYFKSRVLIGNILVAGFVALIPLLVPLFEIPLLKREYHEGILEIVSSFSTLFKGVFLFSVFAFLMTMMYEILKDISGYEGDQECNRRTLVVVLGIKKARNILTAIIIGTLSMSTIILVIHFHNLITIVYYSLFILLPFTLFIIQLMNAKESDEYRRIQIFPKIIMMAGILYSLVAYYFITQI
ncbi:MAG: geranylgeranylglycerol-phosphate geranylgeranyltransferase [Bacteroidales bacterium]|nr:geranylgeranylglycerol-phosphate geranylgeranyltransferase [Bacteroidales bacterium]MCF8457719.1 geranylgeranylglycerol-phosphate geranylgeranyltransferase [Bacteroidales bacterium]